MKLYANAAKYYDLVVYFEFNRVKEEIKLFRKIFGQKIKTVLEMGAGTGRIAVPLAKAGYEVTALDLTPAMLAVAKQKAKGLRNIKFVIGDMTKYKSKKKFDAVICCSSTLLHMSTEKDLLSCLKNFKQNLKPNGILLFDVWRYKNVNGLFTWRKTIKKQNLIARLKYWDKIDAAKRVEVWRFEGNILDKGKRHKVNFAGKIYCKSAGQIEKSLKNAGFNKIRHYENAKFNKYYFVAGR